jgi:hypothetical protein
MTLVPMTAALWDVAPCWLHCNHHSHNDGGRRQPSSYSSPWEPNVSPTIITPAFQAAQYLDLHSNNLLRKKAKSGFSTWRKNTNVSKNLSKYFDLTNVKVIKQCKKLLNEQLDDLYKTLSVVRRMKYITLKWDAYGWNGAANNVYVSLIMVGRLGNRVLGRPRGRQTETQCIEMAQDRIERGPAFAVLDLRLLVPQCYFR